MRLAIVVAALAATYELADPDWFSSGEAGGGSFLSVLVLGAGIGYVTGGLLGRFLARGLDRAEQTFHQVPTGELVAGGLGGLAGLLLSAALVWPVLLFGNRALTLPLAALVAVVLVSAGVRLGRARGGDLWRHVGNTSGVRGAGSPPGTKLVDSSALVDGRLLELCRSGFLEGGLIVPRFVLAEVQGLADAGDEVRRSRGKRGLDVLASLQRSAGVVLEVPEEDYPEIAEVDAKLVAMARDLEAALVTVDSNLARVAEVQGVRVLNLHALAELLRPPLATGDGLRVRIVRPGKEAGQGVGHLDDGTMVVVEAAADRQGQEVDARVTSVLSTANGRLVFARLPDRSA